MEILGQKPVLGTPLDKRHPLAKGLVGCWLLNENPGKLGKVYDLSGYGNHGILEADAYGVPGKFGHALTFDGIGDLAACGTNPIFSFGTGPYTVVTCIKKPAFGYQGVLTFGTYDPAWMTDINGTLLVYDGGSKTASTGAITAGKWYSLGYVRHSTAAGGVNYYINGVQDVTASTHADTISVGTGVKIGTAGGSYEWIGQIDHLMVWNRALSLGEIRQLYLEPFAMFRRKPISLWAVGGVAVKVYTRGDVAAMPADDADLETAFSDSDYDDVETNNAVRVAQTATDEFSAFLFKNKATSQKNISVTWNGQTDRAPSVSTVYLQIYNRNTPAWETLDSDDTTGIDTDFDLEGSVSADLGYYFDGNNEIACRVYQEAK